MYKYDPIKIEDDIRIYSEENYYWGVLPREKMQSLNNFIKLVGFKRGLKEFDLKQRFDYAEKGDRAGFIHFLPLNEEATILDLGSGYGNITIPLAKKFKKVVACDISSELLSFSRMRVKDEGIDNIDFVKIKPLENTDLPFEEGSFDAIILNGVFEWVGAGKTEMSPNFYQKQLLKKLGTLLTRDGILYIAIENRLFPGWIRRDPHSKLKWTSILPRPLANYYAKKNGLKDGYRTYIYSKFGYDQMLKKSGFSNIKYYYPYTTYRAPSYIYGDDGPIKDFLFKKNYLDVIYTHKWSLFIRLMRYLKLDTMFLSSFLIVSSKGENSLIPNAIMSIKREDKDNLSIMKISEHGVEKLLFFEKGVSGPFLEKIIS